MKILFLAHRTPYPPNKGDKIRSFNILSHLAKTHIVSLAYWVDNRRDMEHAITLSKLCRGKVIAVRMNRIIAKIQAMSSLIAGRSFSEGYYDSRKFQRAVDQLLSGGPYDAVYFFSSAMACYGERIQSDLKIVDFVDVDSDKWRQLAEVRKFPLSKLYRLEQKRLSAYEVAVSRWAHWSLFTSQIEADLFKSIGGSDSAVVIPNGVDSDLRRLPVCETPLPREKSPSVGRSKSLKLIFVGTMNYYPNSDAVSYFVREIFPLIRKEYPQTIFEIVGRYPPRSVRQLGGIDGVRVVGEVSEVRGHLAQADVSVAPMRIGRGVQNKVLEAMAVGVPVVATPVAVRGIHAHAEEEVLIADSPESFASQVLRLLADTRLRESIIRRARQRVSETYNWKHIGAQLDRLIGEASNSVSRGVA